MERISMCYSRLIVDKIIVERIKYGEDQVCASYDYLIVDLSSTRSSWSGSSMERIKYGEDQVCLILYYHLMIHVHYVLPIGRNLCAYGEGDGGYY